MNAITTKFEFQVNQKVCFGYTNKVWTVISRDWNEGSPQYFLETTSDFPKYHQYVLQGDLRRSNE